jgi:hypothetical protein
MKPREWWQSGAAGTRPMGDLSVAPEQVGWLLALQDTIDIGGRLPILVDGGPVGDKASSGTK